MRRPHYDKKACSVARTVMMSSASTPSVMMTSTAPAHMAAVTVAAFNLDHRCLGAAESTGCLRWRLSRPALLMLALH